MQRKSLRFKNLSQTRWFARHDARHVLQEWFGILAALSFIAENTEEKPDTRFEAVGLQKKNKKTFRISIFNYYLKRNFRSINFNIARMKN